MLNVAPFLNLPKVNIIHEYMIDHALSQIMAKGNLIYIYIYISNPISAMQKQYEKNK